jgi:hypothetical protein
LLLKVFEKIMDRITHSLKFHNIFLNIVLLMGASYSSIKTNTFLLKFIKFMNKI